MAKIEDGAGNGYLSKVTKDNELVVLSSSRSEERKVSSADRLAFFANTADTANTLTGTTTGGGLLYIQNNHPTKDLTIAKVLVSTDVSGTVIKWTRNPIVGTIANNNTHVPTNLNFGSTILAQGTFYSWDEIGDGMTGFTGGTIINTFISGVGLMPLPIDGAVLLKTSNGMLLSYSGVGEISVGVRFFYSDEI